MAFYDTEDEYDTEEEEEFQASLRHKHGNHKAGVPLVSPQPTPAQMNRLASGLHSRIAKANIDPSLLAKEAHFDTTAVGSTSSSKVYVAFNTKERSVVDGKVEYGRMGGFSQKVVDGIRKTVDDNSLFANGDIEVNVVFPRTIPTNKEANAKHHAEMQIANEAKSNNEQVKVIGINKPPCKNCENVLDQTGVSHGHDQPGNQKPKNWEEPTETISMPIRQRTAAVKNVGQNVQLVCHDPLEVRHNIPQTRADVKAANRNYVSNQLKPKVNCNLTTSGVMDVIDNFDKGPSKYAGVMKASAGTYELDRTNRIGAYASASVAEAGASAGIFGASASAYSASAHFQGGFIDKDVPIPYTVSAGVSAALVRAEAHAGPVQVGVGLQADTGISVGPVEGIQASFLGFGFSVGPKLGVKTPIAEASCSLM